MTKSDHDLLVASAAVAAAFEWEKVDPPPELVRAAQAVLRSVRTGSIIAAGCELAERVGETALLRLDPEYHAALEATDELVARLGYELELMLHSVCESRSDTGSAEPTPRRNT